MSKRSNTRNAQGSGTIRQRSDGRWEARYTVGRDSGTGKQVQRSIYGASEKEVRKKLTQVTASIDDGVYIEPSKLTVSAWLDIWTAEYLGGVKANTASTYKTQCNVHIKPVIGAVKLTALSPHSIQKFYNELHADNADKKGLSAKTIKNIHGVLHKALQQSVKLGYIRFNPSDFCELPRIEKKEIQPLDEDVISDFLSAIKGHKWEALFLVTLFTGMRQGEVLGLRWSCIDFKSGSILIDRQLQRNRESNEWELVTLKNDKSRRITPAQSVLAVLMELRKKQMEWRLMAGQAWINSDLVFTDELGNNLVARTVVKNYKKIVESIGIPEARFHDLRHSYAVVALSSGDDVKTVQENLGHHTAAFTLDVYGHATEKMKKDSADRMEMFIQNVKKIG